MSWEGIGSLGVWARKVTDKGIGYWTENEVLSLGFGRQGDFIPIESQAKTMPNTYIFRDMT